MKSNRSVFSGACAATLGLAALMASATAHANDVYWSIGVSSPGIQVGVQNAPPVQHRPHVVHHYPQVVYPQPQIVYRQPQVVYQQPQVVYVQPRPVYVQPQPIYYQRPAPVYYGAPQVIYKGGNHRGNNGWHNGWHKGHHGNHPHSGGPQVAVRISGQGQSNDQGRNHH
jgi:hypothetical protein